MSNDSQKDIYCRDFKIRLFRIHYLNTTLCFIPYKYTKLMKVRPLETGDCSRSVHHM